jgi:serine/threonine protein kinase
MISRYYPVDDICSSSLSLMLSASLKCRYEITTLAQPHHQSATCTVHLAVDHEDNQRSVALKFMKKRENFDRELQVRQKGSFDNAFIVNILRYYDGDVDEHFVDELQKRGFSVGSYCIVMEAADRNLNEIIEKERFAGLDWEKVRFISESISKAIGHMHAHGFMHGDLKRELTAIRSSFQSITMCFSVVIVYTLMKPIAMFTLVL